ncbi:MAG: alpha/beta fold hydrolase [Microcoleaceae cyanobacterium]
MSTNAEALPTIEWGQGEKILVFLHYFGGAAQSWKWVAEGMPNHRSITMDLPGFGGTTAPEKPSIQYYSEAVCQTLASLNIEEYILIGHSMGGKIALQAALLADKPPQKVVLVAPSPPTTEPMPQEEKERMLNNHPSEENAKITIKNATQKPLNNEQYDLAIKTHIDVDQKVWRWWLLDGMNHSIADQVSQLRIPVTVIASKDDPVIPYNVIQSDVTNIIPSAKLITTQNVGHLIPLEAAGWLAEQL